MATLLASAGLTVQRANAAPMVATWQQPVVTIDDKATVAAAQAWGAPFEVRFAAQGADVHVSRDLDKGGVAGEGVPVEDGDRIVGCDLALAPHLVTDGVILHEFGHCLGLSHLKGRDTVAVMWHETKNPWHSSEVLTDVDRAALADLYRSAR